MHTPPSCKNRHGKRGINHLRRLSDLLLQLCSLKKPKYIQYSWFFQTFIWSKISRHPLLLIEPLFPEGVNVSISIFSLVCAWQQTGLHPANWKSKTPHKDVKRIPPAFNAGYHETLQPKVILGQRTHTMYILQLATANVKGKWVIICTIYIKEFSLRGKPCLVSIDNGFPPC